VHPRILTEGFELAAQHVLKVLDDFKVEKPSIAEEREMLWNVAQTSLRTKLSHDIADQLTDIVVDAVLAVRQEGKPIDLHMVEKMHMLHRTDRESRLVKGLVLDHGARHPDMPRYLENCAILTCNVSLEYEKTEVSSTFAFATAEEREKQVAAERTFTDAKVAKIIELARAVRAEDPSKSFVVINQKGIDPLSLDMLAKEGILALRRAKRRNMERLVLACGGQAVNSVDDLTPECLGWAGKVFEQTLGEDKFTFVEDVAKPLSVTVLLKGQNEHTIAQLKEAVTDGLMAVRNALEDKAVVPGAGAFELAAAASLASFKATVTGKAKLGVDAFAEALRVIPKTLAANSGLDAHDTLIKLEEEAARSGAPIGLDIDTGEPILPGDAGIWDNFRVKRQFLQLGTILATQLLLVDEVMRAGRGTRSG
jgi:T-complex protein 1 subunit zeta